MRKFTTPVQNVQQLSINIHDARKVSGLSQEEPVNRIAAGINRRCSTVLGW